ncbi:Geranylgeranyl pyrophosphate synthase [Microbacterium sp. C448]|jgi:geranylgeranyl pyrophosphate synthase|uniref:polyprenyl synthetase family protein n=1 Tax=Microbacterium TaxID=33882 RepID=UPI0003DE35FD|nr:MULTISPECIES: polyprenyl synthetase family protein [Microbacterium]CDJ98926.1 Geranylgeranyl pyrophosphate synthase [Microbacterium sp. C448]|tara:strand:- start:603 stop:1679 length:1077 start_codon:yes stop_codon:yes gene_type:complete
MSLIATGLVGSVARAEIDTQIDGALARIQRRAEPFGGVFAELGSAIQRSAQGGKRFRPALVVATFESLGGDASTNGCVYPVAAAFELLHAAFLMHDDILDHDTMRRGVPNVSGQFRSYATRWGADASGAALVGDAAGLLAGDLLLHESQRLIALCPATEDERVRLLDLLDEAVLVSAAGELADVAHSVLDKEPAAADILAVTHDKTAVYSFAAPLRAGALLAGASPEVEAMLAQFGSRLGLAYQLVDDLIGAFGTDEQAGRPAGADLREAKQTALIALARATATWSQVSDALALAHTGPIAVRHAQDMLDGSGARNELERLVNNALSEARELILPGYVPPATARMLGDLVSAVEARIP